MRPIQRTYPLFLALILAMLAAACAPAAQAPQAQPVPPSPTPLSLPTSAPAVSSSSSSSSSSPTVAPAAATGDELSGASLYQISCAACHGQDRGGTDFEMDGQKISVPALAWDDLNSTYATDPSRGTVEQQLALAITKGQDEAGDPLEPMMPVWSSLSQSQVDSLVEFLKTADSSGTGSLSPAAANLMGKQLFEAACASCHGSDGAGKSFEMDGNKIDTPALSWSDLGTVYAADASRGTVEQQLALAITKGQDEEGADLEPMMPRWSFLSQTQVDSLVQYLHTAFP